MTGPEGNSGFCFSRISMFPSTSSRETLRFSGNKIHCSPRDQSLSDLLYSETNGSNRWTPNNHFIYKWLATAVKISRVTVNCFPFDVIVLAMSYTVRILVTQFILRCDLFSTEVRFHFNVRHWLNYGKSAHWKYFQRSHKTNHLVTLIAK